MTSRTNALVKTLQELKATGNFPQRLLVRDASLAATLEMDAIQLDRMSVEVSMLRVTPEQVKKLPLRDQAVALSQRITGLMEKLSAIEIDDERGQALLRSESPVADHSTRIYYELLLNRGGSAELHRYQGSMIKSERKTIPFTLTHEALAKLAADIAI
jgi:hypothetical protein